TVVDDTGAPVSNLTVLAFDAVTNYNQGTTDAAGQVAQSLAPGNYRFRATYNGTNFWSGPVGHCAVPACTSATITVNRPVTVTVVDDAGTPISSLAVTAIDGVNPNVGLGNTSPSGQVTRSLASSTYQFRVTYQGANFFS